MLKRLQTIKSFQYLILSVTIAHMKIDCLYQKKRAKHQAPMPLLPKHSVSKWMRPNISHPMSGVIMSSVQTAWAEMSYIEIRTSKEAVPNLLLRLVQFLGFCNEKHNDCKTLFNCALTKVHQFLFIFQHLFFHNNSEKKNLQLLT